MTYVCKRMLAPKNLMIEDKIPHITGGYTITTGFTIKGLGVVAKLRLINSVSGTASTI